MNNLGAFNRTCNFAKVSTGKTRPHVRPNGDGGGGFKEHQAFFMLGGVIRPTIAFSETNIWFKMTSGVCGDSEFLSRSSLSRWTVCVCGVGDCACAETFLLR